MLNTSYCIVLLLFSYFSETTALKCVIERPTRRPTFDLLFEMKFLTLSSLNQSCVNVYVKEIVELFKLMVQSNCSPRPSTKIIADVKNGNVSNLV